MSYQERDFLEKLRDVYKGKLRTDKNGNGVNTRLTPRGIISIATPRQIADCLYKGESDFEPNVGRNKKRKRKYNGQ